MIDHQLVDQRWNAPVPVPFCLAKHYPTVQFPPHLLDQHSFANLSLTDNFKLLGGIFSSDRSSYSDEVLFNIRWPLFQIFTQSTIDAIDVTIVTWTVSMQMRSQESNVECQMSNVKWKMLNVDKLKPFVGAYLRSFFGHFSSDKKWEFERPNLRTESKNLVKHPPKWWIRHLIHAFPF